MSIQYAGGTNVNATFTGAVKADILANVEAQLITAGWSLQQGNVPTTITVTIASPAVVSWTAHGLVAGTRIVFSTTGALPTGITAGTGYFVISAGLTANAFEFSTTLGGSAVNTSGSQSGTHTCSPEILMQSATTAWSVSCRVRMRDNGSNCICFSLENSNSTLAGTNGNSNGAHLLPAAAQSFRIIANKYQCFVFAPAPAAALTRKFVGFGTLYLPSFLQGVITECGWLVSQAITDSDGVTTRDSFRKTLRTGYTFAGSNFQCIANAVLSEGANTNVNINSGWPFLSLPGWQAWGAVTSQVGLLWHDNTALMVEPLIGWGNVPANTTAATSQGLIRGQLWDAVIIMNSFPGDSTGTFDSHNWFALTDSNSTELATLFVVVP
jgi:hypothetical protein